VNRPQLRPLGIGEIVDAAVKLVIGNARTLFTISAIVMVPVAAVQAALAGWLGRADLVSALIAASEDPFLDPATAQAALTELLRLAAILVGVALLSGLGSVLVQGSSVKALADVYQGQVPSWRPSMQYGLRRLFPLLAAAILVGAGSTIGLIFCLVPGVWLFISWSVTVPGLIIEKLGPVKAMARSFRLVRSRFWPVLGTVALAYLIYIAVDQTISFAAGAFTLVGASQAGTISIFPSIIATAISSVLMLPFLAAYLTVLYFDLRVRQEGYDLEILAAELGTLPAAPEEAPADPDDPFGLGRPGDS
jgi:hypothetical protein